MSYWLECWTTKYCQFSGRARRKEFWNFQLWQIVLTAVIGVTCGVLNVSRPSWNFIQIGLVGVSLLPSLGVSVRRLHDISKSGFWFLLVLIPLIGPLILLLFSIRDSSPGENQYGPNPKGIGA